MRIRTAVSAFILTFALLITGCQGHKKPTDSQPAQTAASDTLVSDNTPDSTRYGKSAEFGMSTFTLVTDEGDTLNVTRTANDGTDGKIYGDLREGERYALTTRDNGEAIGILINLTQLDRHLKDYEIRNGIVYHDGKTVDIKNLTDESLETL